MNNAGITDKETETSGPYLMQERGGAGIWKEERLPYFNRMLSNDDENNRWKTAELLGRMNEHGAVDLLIDTLRDDDSSVRLKAVWALDLNGDTRATVPLRRLYRVVNEGARR
jgi:HEAT repeat protein